MIDFKCTLVAYHPEANGPWGVSICSEPVADLTEIKGWIECPDKETAEEIIRRLEAGK